MLIILRSKKARAAAAALAILLVSGFGFTAEAGSRAGSRTGESSAFSLERLAGFGHLVEKELANRGAYVAIVARAGRDRAKLPKGVRYTHVGLWVYSDVSTMDGQTLKGYAVHNLYQTEGDLGQSQLYQDYPIDFFAGAAHLDAGIAIPKPELQARLLEVLADGRWQLLHNPHYSVVSNPNDLRFQNCTEHLLDALISAIYGTDDRARIKANIAAYFEPAPIALNPLERVFGPMFVAGVETSDHQGPIATATFGSIRQFLLDFELAEQTFVLHEADQ